MENIQLDQRASREKRALVADFSETLKKEGFLKVHLPLLHWNDVNDKLNRISVTDGGGLLMVYDRKRDDKYIFRPLNKEEYRSYIKYYIYRENDYLIVQAF